MTNTPEPTTPATLLTVEAAAAQLSIGRTTMYALIRDGKIQTVRVGHLRRVPATALDAYIARLAADQQKT
ncbi:helix-turn-helix domain-containing protein [Actinokineospora iranica]|uniref:DNA binding domain-containing protein, excisionase family n=1 Tax=Actinokineospora iranica TaxID=1271860 RepID=A0A1G6YXC7_9PSEU|nr:helix-turn-helix domain-containing protein [Actinokineospora iranica]SDD94990.1 DNA binding domain-containing protein, excisionase family [Actinokineospora iranica]